MAIAGYQQVSGGDRRRREQGRSLMERLVPRGLTLLLVILAGGAPPLAARPRPAEQDFAALQALDGRVSTIGQRLAVANVDLCPAREWRPGLVVLDLSQVAPAYQAMANRVFGPAPGLGVTALAAEGPAARAGLRAGDTIVALDRIPVVPVRPAAPRGAAAVQPADAVGAAFADGEAEVEIRRGVERLSVTVHAEQGCASRFEIVRSGGRQGWADGRVVQVTLALVDYASDDAELAAVLAHEFAHNLLGHRIRLDAAHVERGFFGNFGRNARNIRETEIEADRMSVYLMDRAGYDPEAAVRFWQRFGRGGLNFLGSPTHPNPGSRIALLESEIAAIRTARAAGRVPEPPLRAPR
jgi:Zn-dependent protease with chaperone function